MNLFGYLADEDHYRELFREGEREARRRLVFQAEETNDVVSEAIENILDYFIRKPEKTFDLEGMEDGKRKNYLKKAVRHQVINIVKKRNRGLALQVDDPDVVGRWVIPQEPAAQGPAGTFSGYPLERMRAELFFFIEERFGRRKWQEKKKAVDLYLERTEGNMSLATLQRNHPEVNVAVMNTTAHRVFKGFADWAKKGGRLRTPENGDDGGG